MTALCCIDTASRVARRYIPQVHAGVRRARCTHEVEIVRPQGAMLTAMLDKFRLQPDVVLDDCPQAAA